MNRFFNLIFALLLLIVLIPVFLFIAIAILLTMGRPVFFIQTRVGQYGQTFNLIKFRTMIVSTGTANDSFDAGNTSRVTQIGKLLRKTKLDEIPQLLNILKGEMAFVGPRPEIPQWTTVYPNRWKKVHSVLPGITDPASIVYRNEEEILSTALEPEITYRDIILPKKLTLSEEYVENRSFFGDIRIMAQTLLALLR